MCTEMFCGGQTEIKRISFSKNMNKIKQETGEMVLISSTLLFLLSTNNRHAELKT